MSAFALRKKLLAQKSPAASPSVDQVKVPESLNGISTDAQKVLATPQKKARSTTRMTRTTRRTLVEQNDIPLEPSALQPGQDSIELPAPFMSQVDQVPRSLSPSLLGGEQEDRDNYGPVQTVNFSSFRPSKTNFRKKKNGISQLKLEDGEVRLR
jgi:hypothetical protein